MAKKIVKKIVKKSVKKPIVKVKKMKWESMGANKIIEGKGFFISFNPNTNWCEEGKMLNGLGSLLGAMLGKDIADDGRAETAIVKDRTYYILNGDFRKEYESLISKGFKACLKFYKSKPECHSGWSTEE